MDDNFKLPSLDLKHKFAPRQPPPPSNNAGPENQPAVTPTVEPDAEPPTALPPPTTSAPAAPPPSDPPTGRSRPPQPQCTYTAPDWSSCPSATNVYSIEMLKGGAIVECVHNLQSRPYWLLGKLPDNHIVMAHPTVSRYHAVLQYRPAAVPTEATDATAAASATSGAATTEPGWYLYDLGSTHGTFVNKRRLRSRTYVPLRVGYQLTVGGSTRRLILQGPDAEAEAESELSVTELRQLGEQRKAAAAAAIVADRERVAEEERRRDADGASWGMAEDADEETDLSVNPYATTQNEELFLQDPKRTLRGYFEREGHELEYKVDELATGSFVCRIELPLSDSNGRTIVCEVSHKGKKKECVAAGALEACRVLDRHGVLRQSHHESRRRRRQPDSGDSEGDDDFYDRTGAVERRREEKAAAAAAEEDRAVGYDELVQQEREMLERLATVNGRIEEYQEGERRAKLAGDGGDDDLDAFMSKLGGSAAKPDRTEIRKLRVEVREIETDHRRLQRLIAIARPADLPALIAGEAAQAPAVEADKKKLTLPLFGKRGTFKYGASPAKALVAKNEPAEKEYKSDEEELEEAKEETGIDEPIAKKVKADGDTDVSSPVKERPEKPVENVMIDELERPTESQKDVEPSEVAEIAAASKKKRNRPRIRGDRGGRDNIDMDEPADLAANSDKYSTWVPPENQSGDGSTSLNDKFGY